MIIFNILLYLAATIFSCIILYYIIKAGVREGIGEALSNEQKRIENLRVLELQGKYTRGEISAELYQLELDKLLGK